MLIDNVDVSAYGCKMIGSVKVSPAGYEQEIYKQRNASWFYAGERTLGTKNLECTVVFFGNSAREIQISRSKLRATLSGIVELFFDFDGFHYTALLESSDETESEDRLIAKTKLKFKAVQHDAPSMTIGDLVVCTSTVPYTSVTVKGTATAESGFLAGVPFSGVSIGDLLEIDGLTGRLLVNDAPGALHFNLMRFPALVPGVNKLKNEGVKNVTTKYSPTYL